MPRRAPTNARGAIEAAAALVADPNHATWVKQHWGEDYLERENLFFRTLLISGLTSCQKLLEDDAYEPLLCCARHAAIHLAGFDSSGSDRPAAFESDLWCATAVGGASFADEDGGIRSR